MSILQMSIAAGIMVIVIVLIRVVALNKMPKKMFLILWGITLCRMLVPVSIPSKFSVYNIINEVVNLTSTNTSADAIDNGVPFNGMAAGVTEQTIKITQQVKIFTPTNIWIAGMLAVFIFFAAVHFKNHRKLRFVLPVQGNDFLDEWLAKHCILRNITIMQSDRITTPVAVGMIKPQIIFPKYMDMDNTPLLQHVLLHEYYHIRRFDTFWKFLLICATCIHWFNPMVWVMFVLVNRDLEFTCDEMVISHFGAETKTAYAYSLIRMAEQRNEFAPLYNGFSKNSVEERITAVMKFKRSSITTIVLAAILVVGITAAFALSATDNTARIAADTADAANTANPVADIANETDNSLTDNTTVPKSAVSAMFETNLMTGECFFSVDNGQTWKLLTGDGIRTEDGGKTWTITTNEDDPHEQLRKYFEYMESRIY